jgi:hypothetical protein
MTPCELQTIGNISVMIIAALFAGIRMSRCRRIQTPCFECDRTIVGETVENTTDAMHNRL